MARARLIDRELFLNEDVSNCSIEARYLYIAIISNSDDEGRMKGSFKYLKAKAFPYDNITEKKIESLLKELTTTGLLLVYQVDNSVYLAHPNWERWQSIRKDRFKPSDCPFPSVNLTIQPVDNQMTTNGLPMPAEPNLTEPNLTELKERIGFAHPLLETVKEYFKEIESNALEAEKFFDYFSSNGWRVGRNPMKDWQAAARNWVKRSYNGKKLTSREQLETRARQIAEEIKDL